MGTSYLEALRNSEYYIDGSIYNDTLSDGRNARTRSSRLIPGYRILKIPMCLYPLGPVRPAGQSTIAL
jgi:hypothetical protein